MKKTRQGVLKRNFRDFQNFVVDILYAREKSGRSFFLRLFLRFFSWAYGCVIFLRTKLYQHRFFKTQPLGCLVMVVGNLTVGGTGKTPVVERLARSLQARGRRVAILSRGYKSKAAPLFKRLLRWITHTEAPPPKVISDGKRILLNTELAGDEPYMLAKNLPGVVVICDKDRVKAGNFAIKKFKVDTLILDDGYQYLPLSGHFNLLLVDDTNPFGNGYLLPRGILREPIRQMKRADCILFTKCLNPGAQNLKWKYKKKKHLEIFCSNHQPRYLQSIPGEQREELDFLRDKKVALFSAIGSPESFENMVKSLGGEIVLTERFIDHHWFTAEELQEFFAQAQKKGAELILTTEKDAVRFPQALISPLDLYFLKIEIEIFNENAFWEKVFAKVNLPQVSLFHLIEGNSSAYQREQNSAYY